MHVSVATLVLVPIAAALAPLLASFLNRWLAIPVIVFEIGLGILIGPHVAGWVKPDAFIATLSDFGLAMLFFLAGFEIDFARIKGRPLQRAGAGWVLSLALGVVVGFATTQVLSSAVLVGICLTSTALGTLMPILRDAGQLNTRFGSAVLATGAAGEFGPLIAVALLLSGRSPARAAVVLAVFAALVAVSLVLGIKLEHHPLKRQVSATLHTTGQFAIRLVILVLAALVGLSLKLGLDMLIGAFAAGVMVKTLLAGIDPEEARTVVAKLDALAFGFLVPVFFINTGVTFDLAALGRLTTALLVPLFAVAFLLVRGLPSTIAAPPDADRRERAALAFFGETGLPIIVAVTAIGVDHGDLKTSTAAALIGAGMLSVLAFPILGLHTQAGQRDSVVVPADHSVVVPDIDHDDADVVGLDPSV
ncbi:MAG TPA: cation:proton antiporter [Frankiaceae bacterium]|jgi:Kef-type K+ transport system membrane component KefB|nr:cation:proton antiporter [Frankiaceae bacterium]